MLTLDPLKAAAKKFLVPIVAIGAVLLYVLRLFSAKSTDVAGDVFPSKQKKKLESEVADLEKKADAVEEKHFRDEEIKKTFNK